MTSQVDGSQPERKSWIANTVSYEAIYRKYIYDIRTATWLSHGDRNDEQQLSRARLPETGPGSRADLFLASGWVHRGTDGRWSPVTAGMQAAAVGSLRSTSPLFSGCVPSS